MSSPETEALWTIVHKLESIDVGIKIIVGFLVFSVAYKIAAIYIFADPKEPKE